MLDLNMLRKAALVVALAAAIQGCSRGPAIDASTQQKLQDSIQVIRDGLEGDELVQFDNSLALIVASTIDPLEIIDTAYKGGRLPTMDSAYYKLKPVLDGKRLADVLAMRGKARDELESRLKSWQATQVELNKKYQAYVEAKGSTEGILPVSANLSVVNSTIPMFGDNMVKVDVTFKNNTTATIEAISFNLMLMPPTVPQPWVTQNVERKFEPALKPGESQQITTDPIHIVIPETYKGDVQLETAIDVKGLDKGGGMIKLPSWDDMNTVILAKYEAAIHEAEGMLANFGGNPSP